VYKGIKSQVLHQKEKIKTPKNPQGKTTNTLKMPNPLTTAPQKTNTANNDQWHLIVILLQTFSFDHHSSSGLSEETSQQPKRT